MEYLPQVVTKENAVTSDTTGSSSNVKIKETTSTLQVIRFFNSRSFPISSLTIYDKINLKSSKYRRHKHDTSSRIRPVILEHACPPHGWTEIALQWIVSSDDQKETENEGASDRSISDYY